GRIDSPAIPLPPCRRPRHHWPPRSRRATRSDSADRLHRLAVLERHSHLFPDWTAASLPRRFHVAVGVRDVPAWRPPHHRCSGTTPRSMTAILLALTAIIFLGGGLVLTQFGLRYIHPLSGAAISIPTFTLCFLLASPFLLRGETVVWNAV